MHDARHTAPKPGNRFVIQGTSWAGLLNRLRGNMKTKCQVVDCENDADFGRFMRTARAPRFAIALVNICRPCSDEHDRRQEAAKAREARTEALARYEDVT